MPRFSLSPPRGAETTKFRDATTFGETDTEESSSSASSSDDDDYSSSASSADYESDGRDSCSTDDEDEEEEPHPLGFPKSFGRTRFVLDPADIAVAARKDRSLYPRWFDPEDCCDPLLSLRSIVAADGATGSGTGEVGTGALLAHDRRRRRRSAHSSSSSTSNDRTGTGNDDGVMGPLTSSMERIASLVSAAKYLHGDEAQRIVVPTCGGAVGAASLQSKRLWDLAEAAERERRIIRRQSSDERRRIDQEQERAAAVLRQLIQRDQKKADEIEERERVERERLEEAERRRAEAERAEEERAALLEKERADEAAAAQAEREKAAAQAQRERAEEDEARAKVKAEAKAKLEAEAARRDEYKIRAEKLMGKLVEIRSSLAPFESNKAVSRRRLQFKKIVRGRLNTLSHDAEKIRAVAFDVVNAINAARTEDDQIKSQLQETGALADGGLSHDMVLGKRYLLDLLCSNVIVRVQAEGFNGTRGDGFPLGALLASVGAETKEFVPLLAAHLYTACPATIPRLPDVAEDESETGLMESLGMLKGKDGQYETFDRFLTRTEGLVSIIANIMASIPSDHKLMGGHKGALDWLARFLDLLPPAPQNPLPLLTAPVLVAFLTGAGHMLANKFPAEFQQYLDAIVNDIATRLDTGVIGQPSATRLKKVLDGGFDGFRTTLPLGAVEAYYDASSSGESVSAPSLSAPAAPGSTAANPFSAAANAASIGHPQQQQQQQQPLRTTSSQSPFEQRQPTNPGFGPSSTTGGFGTTSTTSGGTFGSTATGASDAFGSSLTTGGSNPFGSQQQFQQQPPFGGTSAGDSRPPCKFFAQGKCRNGASCKFSHENPGVRGGGGGGAFNSNPFAHPGPPPASAFASNATASFPAPAPAGGFTSFGAAPAPASTFGQSNAAPTPFGSPAPAPGGMFGGGANTTNAFGAPSQPSGFGTANTAGGFGQTHTNTTSPFAAQAPSTGGGLFGGGGTTTTFRAPAPAPSPFNNNSFGNTGGNNNAFGGNSFSGSTSGGGLKKPPCKFFAQGRCRNGNACKFSHESVSGGNANTGFNSNPFGGGGTSSGFNSNPFGGPRR